MNAHSPFYILQNILCYFKDDGCHTTIIAEREHFIPAPLIVGDLDRQAPVLFRGMALVADESNRLWLELLRTSITAYSSNPHSNIDEVL